MTKRFLLVLALLLVSAPTSVLAASKPLSVIVDHGYNSDAYGSRRPPFLSPIPISPMCR